MQKIHDFIKIWLLFPSWYPTGVKRSFFVFSITISKNSWDPKKSPRDAYDTAIASYASLVFFKTQKSVDLISVY